MIVENKKTLLPSPLFFFVFTLIFITTTTTTIPFSYAFTPLPKHNNKYTTSSTTQTLLKWGRLSPEQRQRIRDKIEDQEDADFLLADIKPKALVHERDYFRQSTRMEAWDEYVLVSILITSISYGALQGFAVNADHEGIYFYTVILKTAIQTTAGLAVLCGLYSTMVFSLSILYGKTALGLEMDGKYDEFLEKTQEVRDNAFLAFSSSLALFAIIVTLVLAEELPLYMQLPVGGIIATAMYFGYKDWAFLVDSASEIYDYMYIIEDVHDD